MVFSLFVSFSDSYNFGREEIFNIRVVATTNNHRTFNTICLHYLQNNHTKNKIS